MTNLKVRRSDEKSDIKRHPDVSGSTSYSERMEFGTWWMMKSGGSNDLLGCDFFLSLASPYKLYIHSALSAMAWARLTDVAQRGRRWATRRILCVTGNLA